ncbi:MAG: serine/threonine protein kinase [Thermoguttaceae bacterium]|nr:serine/threonine protein kinase [Thermoguttaceae bacterium]
MSDIVTTQAKDGSTVEFVYKDPKQGGVKDVYFSPDKSYVVAFFRKKLDVPSQERIDKLVGKYREMIFNQVGGDYWRKIFCWPEKIVNHDGKTGIVVPSYRKQFFFGAGPLEDAEKEGKWFASAKNFNCFVPPEERGSLASFLRICLNLSRGVRRLHAAGLAHSDLSYKNCLVDPKSGDACIIDLDGLVVPGLFPPDVLGTPDFIAPEVVASTRNAAQKVLPSRSTDQHALAVLNYLYLLHRHPLRGPKVWSKDNDQQEFLEMGEKAIFIENPNDKSNRPRPGDEEKRLQPWCEVDKIPFTTTGPYLTSLFTRAFVDGLHKPELRPSADDWEDALLKTTDLLLPCENKSCVKKFFIYNNKEKPVCPYCGTSYKLLVPVFDFYSSYDGKKFRPEGRRLVVWSGQSLYEWHRDRMVTANEKLEESKKKRLGYFQYYNGKWMLVNERMDDLTNLTTKQPVPRGQYVELTNGLQLQLSKSPTGRIVNVQLANV